MMRTTIVGILASLVFAPAAPRAKMTYEQAQQRLPTRRLPDFWVGDVKDLPARFAKLGRGRLGRDQPELRRLGDACRLLIVPCGNPDGTARFEPWGAHGMPLDEFQFWGMGTWSDDTIAVWPTSKRQHPRVGPEIGFLGCYFNDRGINPMHDEFFAPMGPEAPAILRVALQEGPDLAAAHNELLARRKLPYGGLFDPTPERGAIPKPLNLTSAIYHVSGATVLTHECPHGIADENMCRVTFEQILDVQFALYEVMLRHALEKK